MKKTTVWATRCRSRLAFSSGRISSIAAPVVPTKLAISPPRAMIAVFVVGVPRSPPRTAMPPEMQYSVSSSVRKGMYSITEFPTAPSMPAKPAGVVKCPWSSVRAMPIQRKNRGRWSPWSTTPWSRTRK